MQVEHQSKGEDGSDLHASGENDANESGQDDSDIPLLLETVEPEGSAKPKTGDSGPASEDDELVPVLTLDDALIIEDANQKHMAPLVDPLDEDGRHRPHGKAEDVKEMVDLQAAVAQAPAVQGVEFRSIRTAPTAPAAPPMMAVETLSLATMVKAGEAYGQPIPSSANGLGPSAASPTDSSSLNSAKAENPFLPQHILDKLNQGRRNLVEEIAQSSAALDASTALFRSRTRNDRFSRTGAASDELPPVSRSKIREQRDQLVDELVDEFLPLVAAELRRKLKKMLSE